MNKRNCFFEIIIDNRREEDKEMKKISKYLTVSFLTLFLLNQGAVSTAAQTLPIATPGNVKLVVDTGVTQMTQTTGLKPRLLHKKPSKVRYWKGLHRERVLFKMRDGIGLRVNKVTRGKKVYTVAKVNQDVLQSMKITSQDVAKETRKLNKILNSREVVGVAPLFSRTAQQIQNSRSKAQSSTGQVHSHLENYYLVRLRKQSKGERIGNFLNRLTIVEIAYLPPIPLDAEDVPPSTPDFEGNQGYLEPAENNGIDARFAWTIKGGRGQGTRVVDIETGWNLNHEDLPGPFFTGIANQGVNTAIAGFDDHGTAVLGVLVANNDGIGVTGIVSDAEYAVVSNVRLGALFGGSLSIHGMSVADAVNVASGLINPGDVIVIEQHSAGPETPNGCDWISGKCQTGFVPMEFFPATFDAILQATNNGQIVVEAAGNGSVNLDSTAYGDSFNRNFRDSGAILVGASKSTSHERMGFSNFGERVDLHGWGQKVETTGYGDPISDRRVNGDDKNQFYTSLFSGTSSATPIVAGAVLSMQGILRANNRAVLNAVQMRNLLTQTGTPQEGDLATNIGPMPNLRAAIEESGLGTGTSGGTGGSQYRLDCDEGEFLVGLRGLSGQYIDQVRAICSDGSGVQNETGSVGGNGVLSILGITPQPYEIKCNAGFAVTGIQGFSGSYIDSMRLECRSITNTNGVPTGAISTTNSAGGNGGATFGPSRCNNNQIAAGISGRFGQFVDDIQLVCKTVTPTVSNITSWSSPQFGGNGGDDFTVACNAGETLVGVSVGSGQWIDTIAARCTTVDNNGNWGDTVTTRNRTGGQRPFFPPPPPVNFTCPANHAVVGFSGRADDYVDNITLRCKPLASPDRVTTGQVSLVGPIGGSGGTSFGPEDCPNNLIVSSLVGKSGWYIDKLGIQCGN